MPAGNGITVIGSGMGGDLLKKEGMYGQNMGCVYVRTSIRTISTVPPANKSDLFIEVFCPFIGTILSKAEDIVSCKVCLVGI
ncbi:MAG TPA: hypothetical protein VLL52_13570 [Anaerolineae bacterium]|nr:hypothetical protein [Anaerolineae bacterium]